MTRLAVLTAALSLTVVVYATVASPSTSVPTLTPQQVYRQIRACLVKRGAFVKRSSDPGGGFAYWGSNRTATGRWGSWSYATQSGQVIAVLTMHSRLTPKQGRSFKFCTRWPR